MDIKNEKLKIIPYLCEELLNFTKICAKLTLVEEKWKLGEFLQKFCIAHPFSAKKIDKWNSNQKPFKPGSHGVVKQATAPLTSKPVVITTFSELMVVRVAVLHSLEM